MYTIVEVRRVFGVNSSMASRCILYNDSNDIESSIVAVNHEFKRRAFCLNRKDRDPSRNGTVTATRVKRSRATSHATMSGLDIRRNAMYTYVFGVAQLISSVRSLRNISRRRMASSFRISGTSCPSSSRRAKSFTRFRAAGGVD